MGVPAKEVKVQIGDLEVTLQKRSRMSISMDVLAAARTSPHRALCAALGMCWVLPISQRPKTKYESCGYDALKYGGIVLDELAALGLRPDQIVEAAGVAYNLITEDLLDWEEVASAEDFTDPSEAG